MELKKPFIAVTPEDFERAGVDVERLNIVAAAMLALAEQMTISDDQPYGDYRLILNALLKATAICIASCANPEATEMCCDIIRRLVNLAYECSRKAAN